MIKTGTKLDERYVVTSVTHEKLPLQSVTITLQSIGEVDPALPMYLLGQDVVVEGDERSVTVTRKEGRK